MAMTKTVTLRDIVYTPARVAPKDPLTEPAFVWVHYEINIDDPDDDQLPIIKQETRRYKAGDDVSAEDTLVQNIFNIVFNT